MSGEGLTVRDPDLIDHPGHYNRHPSGIECIDIVEHMPFNIGNAVKYLWRAGEKDGEDPITALRKAQWYVSREVARLRHTEHDRSAE